jgi:hypothetical protein
MEVNAQAKRLLLDEKTTQTAQRLAKNDPTGAAWQANRDAMLAEIDQRQAKAKRDYEEKWVPTVESGGTTTSKTSRTVTKDDQSGGADKPLQQSEREAAANAGNMTSALEQIMGTRINPSSLDKLQENEVSLVGAEKRQSEGQLGAAQVNVTRKLGITPKGPLDGIPQKDRDSIANWGRSFAAIMRDISGATVPDGEVRRLAITYMPRAGDTAADEVRKQKGLLEYIENAAIKAGRLQPEVQQLLAPLRERAG